MTTETDPTGPGLKARYASKVAGDIEENEADQLRVQAQIQALQEQLVSLRADRELLTSMSAALGDVTLPDKATRTVQAAVPSQPARKTATRASARPKAGKRRSSTRGAGGKGAALTDLIHGYLSEEPEPRSTSEILQSLAGAHPERQISDPLVRTSAERLVARGKLERSKRGSSVLYTVSTAD
ncbi:hypothetical protein [Streptomyces sp. NPDC050848]|uniref:hypothetical protein n=1 Tax=Streptomyces sp. NPDC050848 TaxID=3155791 RepID=UPI00340D5F61